MRFLVGGPVLALLMGTGCLVAFSSPVAAFGLGDVAARAAKLAEESYKAPDTDDLPKSLRELNYDQYRDIRFRPERALWHNSKSPFEIQFFHPGFYFMHPVRINIVDDDDKVMRLRLNPADFNYGKNKQIDKGELKNLGGYAGFRIHFPINTQAYKDEVGVFLGASYFRGLGRNQLYGMSARGLAIDTAEMSGEEFPAFTEFWIVKPEKKASELVIYALLDSKRMTGAYRFVLRPGGQTQMDVQAALFFRDIPAKVGLAPLTSMFFFAENQGSEREDFRPEVHDSDGLQVQGNDEWIWRPLVNPERLLVTSFVLKDPKGFGLMQRDRDFGHYQDLESHFERRPSAWVEPLNKWGDGRVELVQIPTPDETNDNIVAYWIPGKLPEKGKRLDLRYRLSWQSESLRLPTTSWVTQTRRGRGWGDTLRFIVDFEGPALRKLGPAAKVDGMVWIGQNGEIVEHQTYPNPVTGGWRVSLRFQRKGTDPVEMRLNLRHRGKVVSETWSYVLP